MPNATLVGTGDSSLVLALAAHALTPSAVTAVTAVSPSYPAGELGLAGRVAAGLGVAHRTVVTHEVEREAYARNGEMRCYHCKAELYATLAATTSDAGDGVAVLAGANADDLPSGAGTDRRDPDRPPPSSTSCSPRGVRG